MASIKKAKKNSQRWKPSRKPAGTKKQRRKIAVKVQAIAKDMRGNGGQPSTYDKHFAKMALPLCEKGATDADLADFFGVTTTTIWAWSTRHQEFSDALRAGKGAYDDRIERSLAARAIGYSFSSEKLHFTKSGKVTRAQITEHVPPDPKAAEFWLTNRRGDDWKSKQTTEFDPDKPLKIVVEGGLPSK